MIGSVAYPLACGLALSLFRFLVPIALVAELELLQLLVSVPGSSALCRIVSRITQVSASSLTLHVWERDCPQTHQPNLFADICYPVCPGNDPLPGCEYASVLP